MRLNAVTLVCAAALCCCGGGGSSLAPSSIDGLWSAQSDGLGSTLTMNLKSSGAAISGTGTYSVGAIRSGSLSIVGSYRPPAAALTITYDHGAVVTFAATVGNSEKMAGRLTQAGGTGVDLEFVRP